MASPAQRYQREMHDNLGFFATWLPADPVAVGDVGILAGGRFRREGSLSDLGIACHVVTDPVTQDLQYTSTEGTRVTVQAGAAAATVVQGEIAIEFSRQGAFVFQATALRPHRIENRAEVGRLVLEAYDSGRWQKDWLLIESLHSAERGTVIVSEDSAAGLVLLAKAEVPLPALSLSDPRVGLTVAATRGRMVHVVGAAGLRPLYSCVRLKDPWLGPPSLRPVRGAAPVGTLDSPFVRPSIDVLLDS